LDTTADPVNRTTNPQFQPPELPTEPAKHTETSIFSAKEGGYLRDIAAILDPPDLDAWREKLFHVDETIVLSEEQYVPSMSPAQNYTGLTSPRV
jgi:hypothetical protein